MKKTLPILMLAMVSLLAACGRREAVAPGDGSNLDNVTNEVGGYAGDLAAPPAEQAQVDPASLEANIEAGGLTDSRDREEQPEEVQAEEEPVTPVEDDVDPKFSKERVKTDDAKWASNAKPVAALQFNKGVVYLELWPDIAPKTVESFQNLIGKQFYDGIFIHRVEPGFVMQVGDPLTKQFGGPSGPGVGSGGPGYTVPAEFSSKPHIKGTLSMARTEDPNSGGSQFFICLDRATHLDNQYTVFGQVLGNGMDIVDTLKVGDQIVFGWMVKK